MAALYALVKDATKDRLFALVTLAVCAFSPWHFMQSRWFIDCNSLPHVLIIAIWLLLKGEAAMREGKPGWKKAWAFYASMPVFALALYTYGIAIYVVPPLMLMVCIYMLSKKIIGFRQAAICLGLFTLVAWPIFAMFVINLFRLPTIELPFMTIPFFEHSARAQHLVFFSPDPLRDLALNIPRAFGLGVALLDDVMFPWNAIIGFGAGFLFTVPLMILGAIFIIRRKSENGLFRFVILVWYSFSLLAGFITFPNINRMNYIYYATIILTAAGIIFVIRSSKKIAVAYAAAFALFFALFLGNYFGPWAISMERIFLKDFGQAVTFARELPADRYFVTSWSQFDGASHVSEVLWRYYNGMDTEPIFFRGGNLPAIAGRENAVYVIRDDEVGYLQDFEGYVWWQKGRFWVARYVGSGDLDYE